MPHTKKLLGLSRPNHLCKHSANSHPGKSETNKIYSLILSTAFHQQSSRLGLGFVVKYTYARGQVTKSEDMPRPDARGRIRGQLFEVEDKISASRTV